MYGYKKPLYIDLFGDKIKVCIRYQLEGEENLEMNFENNATLYYYISSKERTL